MESLFINYDDLLIGKIPKIDVDNFYGITPGGTNERKALSCVRYCIEDILNWDADTAVKKFDAYIIKVMKLEQILRFIKFPVEVRKNDPKYILSRLYPDKISLNEYDLVKKIYKEVLDGTEAQFPRNYFTGEEGFERFCSCLSYLLSNYKTYSSLDELYEFVLSSEGKELLDKMRLKAVSEQFALSVIDALRELTLEYDDCELYYIRYALREKYNELIPKIRKKRENNIVS